MDCQKKFSGWKPLDVYAHNPKLKRGNFAHLCSGAFVIDAQATDKLRAVLKMAGELLPIEYEDTGLSLFNALECVNCLDGQETKWVLGKTTGTRIRIVEYHFRSDRLSESSIFKIPETAKAEILCIEGMKDPEDEFKAQVEAAGFTGLLFDELWSGDHFYM